MFAARCVLFCLACCCLVQTGCGLAPPGNAPIAPPSVNAASTPPTARPEIGPYIYHVVNDNELDPHRLALGLMVDMYDRFEYYGVSALVIQRSLLITRPMNIFVSVDSSDPTLFNYIAGSGCDRLKIVGTPRVGDTIIIQLSGLTTLPSSPATICP